jgi:hypothetical protein
VRLVLYSSPCFGISFKVSWNLFHDGLLIMDRSRLTMTCVSCNILTRAAICIMIPRRDPRCRWVDRIVLVEQKRNNSMMIVSWLVEGEFSR